MAGSSRQPSHGDDGKAEARKMGILSCGVEGVRG
jgi:hypothetical protein